MYFYRSSPYSYNSPAAQQAMYMQLYSQPIKAYQPSGVSTYVSGNLVKTGSYIKGLCLLHIQKQSLQFLISHLDAEYIKRKVNARIHSVSSVAEAYPEGEPELLHDDADIPEDDIQSDLPVAAPEHDHDEPAYDNIPVADEAPVLDTPVVPLKPKQKKTTVQVSLDHQNDDEEEEDDYMPARRGSSGGSNTYFPIRFGNTNGGAIAIANAFSNGKGGTAASRATAYGNPTKKRI